MLGTMMDFPLTLVPILERAGKLYRQVEIVSRRPDRTIARTNYGAIYRRARRLARALELAGLARGERVATLMWNHGVHLEAYFGIPLAGGVLHTLNLRLPPTSSRSSRNHASDRFLIVDDVLLPVLQKFRCAGAPSNVFSFAALGACEAGAIEDYEDLLKTAPTTIARIHDLMRTTPRPCATPPERPAIRRAWSTRIARWCCTSGPGNDGFIRQ